MDNTTGYEAPDEEYWKELLTSVDLMFEQN